MRFDFEAYKKVFPEEPAPAAPIESAVDTFKPTEAEAKAKDNKPGTEDLKAVPDPTPEPVPDTKLTEPPAPEGDKDE